MQPQSKGIQGLLLCGWVRPPQILIMGVHLKMKRKYSYPDYSMWEKEAIHTDSGLIFAPEDFYVIDEEGNRRDLFTLDEAMGEDNKIIPPKGWRLPTYDEWEMIADEFDTPKRIRLGLNMDFNGIVSLYDFDEYKDNLGSFEPIEFGESGYYWSSTQWRYDSVGVLHFFDKALLAGNSLEFAVEIGDGCSVRYVLDKKNQ